MRSGYFDEFGGRYAPEVLQRPLAEIEDAFRRAMDDTDFWKEFHYHARSFTGRPTPLLFAERSSEVLQGARIYVKLEGLANTGAHKINNALGQCLLAKRLGKTRIIAETGAGQHGAATAAACARLGLECRVYMGSVDKQRQYPNVYYMRLFGAEVIEVTSGAQTLKDAVNEALRDWADSFDSTHYVIGSALGPAPYPDMVREFQSVVGRETEQQLAELGVEPDVMIASVGGGSNAIGFFAPYLECVRPRLVGVEAGGDGTLHAARMSGEGRVGIVHGYKSLFLSDDDGQIRDTHSIAAGLDYPGVGPELAALGAGGRVEFLKALDDQALEGLSFFAGHEGLVFALESAHAAYHAIQIARELSPEEAVVVHMSGRGDKDLFIAAPRYDVAAWRDFLEKELRRLDG